MDVADLRYQFLTLWRLRLWNMQILKMFVILWYLCDFLHIIYYNAIKNFLYFWSNSILPLLLQKYKKFYSDLRRESYIVEIRIQNFNNESFDKYSQQNWTKNRIKEFLIIFFDFPWLSITFSDFLFAGEKKLWN